MVRHSRFLPSTLLFLVVLAAGCQEDESILVPEPPRLDATYLTVQPRALEPDSVAELAAVIDGFPDAAYAWSASAGTLLDNNNLVVSWRAPATTGRYTVSYRAETSGAKSSFSRVVSVNHLDELTTGNDFKGWQVWEPSGTRVYFLATPVSTKDENFAGLTLASMNASDGMGKTPEIPDPGFWHTFTRNVDAVTYYTVADGGPSFIEDITTIYLATLPGGIPQVIATPNEYLGSPNRRDVLTQPNLSSGGGWVGYTRFIPDTTARAVTADSTEAFAYHVPTGRTFRVTTSSKVGTAMPINGNVTISPNEDRVVMARFANNRIHLWSYAVQGDTIDPGSEVRISDVGGNGLAGTLYRYSPDGTRVAYLGSDGALYINAIDGTGTEFGASPGTGRRVVDVAWSPDGLMIAWAVAIPDLGDQIFFAPVSQLDAPLEVKGGFLEDTHFGVTWSPDGSHLLYYVGRLPDLMWLEVYDLASEERISMSPHSSRFRIDELRSLYGAQFEFRPSPDPVATSLDVIYVAGDPTLLDFDIEQIWKARY